MKNLKYWNKKAKEKRNDNYLFISEIELIEKIDIKNINILDIGIGTGRTTKVLSKAKNYIGIDYSKEMIKKAKEKSDCKLLVMNATEINFKEKFDLILFSFNGIDNLDIKEKKEFIKKASKHLSEKGILAFSSKDSDFYKPNNLLEIIKIYGKKMFVEMILLNNIFDLFSKKDYKILKQKGITHYLLNKNKYNEMINENGLKLTKSKKEGDSIFYTCSK